NRSPRPSKKLLPPALSAPITWPISDTKSSPHAPFSPSCSCAIRNSINSPPTRCPCSTTMPSFCKPERSLPMTLPEKLSQLRLTTMAQNLETMTREAEAQNLSFAAALERLADLELQGPPRPRYRAPLPALAPPRAAYPRPVPLPPSQIPPAGQKPPPPPARLGLPPARHQCGHHWQSRRRENLLGADPRLARLPSQRARALHHRHGDAQPVARFPGRSLPGPQTQGLHRARRLDRGRT